MEIDLELTEKSAKNTQRWWKLTATIMIETSKSCDLNFANSGRDTEAKTSPRHLNFLKQLNKTTEMCYPYISGFKIHQGT